MIRRDYVAWQREAERHFRVAVFRLIVQGVLEEKVVTTRR